MEYLTLEATHKEHQVCFLNSDRLGAMITSLGSLFQWLNHPLSEEPFPNVQSGLSLMQPYHNSLCPIAGQQREINTTPFTALFEEAVACDEVTPQPSLLQA